jgi:hypothetical protein
MQNRYRTFRGIAFYHSLSYSFTIRCCVQIFRARGFAKFQKRERIKDISLSKAIDAADRGLLDADLGGGLIKQRVARTGQGKSGGYRTVIAYRRAHIAVFLFGFAKNERPNIEDDELEALRNRARRLLDLDADQLEILVANGDLTEVGGEK